jgi:uncharacterized membrane protein
MKKREKTLFTVSVLANILLAGALAGMIADHPRDVAWDDIKKELSPPSQELVTKMFQDTWKDTGAVFRQSMDNRKYLADVVAADKFEPAKFDEAVKRLRGTQDLIAQKKIESTKELLGKLPTEDRKKLAERVADSFTWKGGNRRPGKRPHDYPRPPEGAQPGDQPPPPPPAAE